MTTRTTARRRTVPCRGCGRNQRNDGDGLCPTCNDRWRAAGRPATVPPPLPVNARVRRSIELRGDNHQAQLEDFAELTEEHGVPLEEAARRLGVSLRTVQRYRSELRLGVS